MKKFSSIPLVLALFLLGAGLSVRAQDKVMQVHSKGRVAYEVNTSQVDSITFTAPSTCNFDNPLTDLPWLKEVIDAYEESAARDIAQGYKPQHARITQCTYKDGVGFLLEMCVGCPDFGYSFCTCEGVPLCIEGTIVGHNDCYEFNIDLVNGKVIWEKGC